MRGRKSVDVAVEENLGTVDPQTGERPDLVHEVEPYYNVNDLEEKARKLKFLEEPVQIFLHESANPNEEPAVYLAINGEPAVPGGWLVRGREYTIKRKFIALLVAAKTTMYAQPYKNEARPELVNQLTARRSQRYPFSVQNDTPEGAKWLSKLMAQ